MISNPEIHPDASDWITRTRYREAFHLSAEQMDGEPLEEYHIVQEIWRMDSRKEKLENRRREQKPG